MMALVGKRERPMKRLFKAAGERGHSRSSSSNIPQDKRQRTAEFPGSHRRAQSASSSTVRPRARHISGRSLLVQPSEPLIFGRPLDLGVIGQTSAFLIERDHRPARGK
jgi:hypothetical protein